MSLSRAQVSAVNLTKGNKTDKGIQVNDLILTATSIGTGEKNE